MHKRTLTALLIASLTFAAPVFAQDSSSSAQSSAQSNGGSGNCDALTTNSATAKPIDAAALAAVTSVSVMATSDCSGLDSLSSIDAAGQAAMAANASVAKSLQTQGYSGAQIIGYALDGASLTVYVKK